MKKTKQDNLDINIIKNLEEDSLSLTDVLFSLARHIKIILFIPSVFCMITIINVQFFIRPIYKSTAKIMSSTNTANLSQAMGIAAQFGINMPSSQSEPKWVYSEIIKSRTIAKTLLKRKFSTLEFGSDKTLIHILTYDGKNRQQGIDTLNIIAIDKLLSMIGVSDDIKTGILTLSIEAYEPKFATELNEALIEELDSHQKRYNKAKTSETKQFIESRIFETEKELIAAEESLKIFMDRNRRIENSPSLQLEQQRLNREASVLTGVFTTLKQQLETTKIEEVRESDYVVIIDPPEIPLKKSKPNKKMMVVLAGILGLGLGIIFAFFKDLLLNSTEEDKIRLKAIKKLFSKNILSIVPKFFKNKGY